MNRKLLLALVAVASPALLRASAFESADLEQFEDETMALLRMDDLDEMAPTNKPGGNGGLFYRAVGAFMKNKKAPAADKMAADKDEENRPDDVVAPVGGAALAAVEPSAKPAAPELTAEEKKALERAAKKKAEEDRKREQEEAAAAAKKAQDELRKREEEARAQDEKERQKKVAQVTRYPCERFWKEKESKYWAQTDSPGYCWTGCGEACPDAQCVLEDPVNFKLAAGETLTEGCDGVVNKLWGNKARTKCTITKRSEDPADYQDLVGKKLAAKEDFLDDMAVKALVGPVDYDTVQPKIVANKFAFVSWKRNQCKAGAVENKDLSVIPKKKKAKDLYGAIAGSSGSSSNRLATAACGVVAAAMVLGAM